MNKAIILAGGQGKRMKADMPKPLFKVLGEPMLEWVITACESAGISDICVIKGFKGEMIDDYLNGRYTTALQAERLGTGHAVMQAVPFLKGDTSGNTLVLCGDAPFIDEATIKEALALHEEQGNAVTVITSELDEPFGYGRIVRSGNGGISGIVEQKDADEKTAAINEVNSGGFWFDTEKLLSVLDEIKSDNNAKEYYLPDALKLLLEKNEKIGAYTAKSPDTVLGANDPAQLKELEDIAVKKGYKP